MNAPQETVARRPPANRLVRRVAATLIIGALLFSVLWLVAFSVFTSVLIASGFCVVIVAASAASDPFETVLDVISTIVLGVLGAIAAVFAAIFSIFID